MRIRHYIYIAAAALTLLPACEEENVWTAPETDIKFAAPLATRATATPAGSNFVFQVRDYYNSSSYYIDNETIVSHTSSEWRYGSGRSYIWSNGTHCFFGWSQTDGEIATADFFGANLTVSGPVVTTPAKVINTSTTQYDFLYSDMVTRRTAENDYSAIPLTFKHLFAQVGISFRVDDITTEEITLTRVYLSNTMNVGKTAEIDFSTEDPEVTYTASSQGYYVTPVNLNITGFNSSSTPVDVLAQVQNGGRQYYYTWPMTENELKSMIVVEYTLTKNSAGSAVNMDFVSVMNFPKGSKWEAGNKYQYVIAYMGGILKVEEQLLPWDYEESTGNDIPEPTMATWKGWDDITCTVSGTNVTFKENQDGTLKKVHGMLVVSSPSNCTLHINLSNHISGDDIAYIIKDSQGHDITTSGITIGGSNGITPGATIDFYIEAVESKRPAYGEAPLTSSLSFSIQASDREVSMDSELQRDGQYNIIIPALSE